MKNIKTEKKLLLIFLLLVLIVSILGIKTHKLSKTKLKEEQNVDLKVPILKKNQTSRFNITISKLKKDDELNYVVKIVNYEDKLILKKDINYNLELDYDENISIEVYEQNKNINLLTDDKKTEDIKLRGNQKEEKIYILNIKTNNDIDLNKISVRVNS